MGTQIETYNFYGSPILRYKMRFWIETGIDVIIFLNIGKKICHFCLILQKFDHFIVF
jgi:hypothetical protein